jgi:uroporphyrinogen-III synthase
VDAVLHTSSLSARLTVERARELFGEGYRWNAINAAIGPPTRDTLLSLGLEVQVTPGKATFPDLVAAAAEALGQ